MTTPWLLTSDNKPNQLVANGEVSASRSRYLLRKYLTLMQRIADGQVIVRFVSDAHNPADFLTKWISAEKFEKSLEYATNSANAVEVTCPEFREQARLELEAAIAAATARLAAGRA